MTINYSEDITATFRGVFQKYRAVRSDPPIPTVLDSLLADAQKVIATLESYRFLQSSASRNPVTDHCLYQWYALSRLNDFLIADFQQHTELYVSFFEALGFRSFGTLPYHPFYYEIVAIIEDPAWTEEPMIDQLIWPGLCFGEMLFSRAGVRLRCAPGTFVKRIAEGSCLYFTYWRPERETADLSQGWGHNSQWATCFRCDYDTGGFYHFNVDGKHPLNDLTEYVASFPPEEWPPLIEEDPEELTIEERIELLVNRCFVRCTKRDRDRWPYDDTYRLSKRQLPTRTSLVA